MSDNENMSPSKQTSSVPTKQTSTIPLKKETVRVTLKVTGPPVIPSATLSVNSAPKYNPPTPPVVSHAPTPPTVLHAPAPVVRPAAFQPPSVPPVAIKPPVLAPTVPPRPAGAPTVALKPANAPLPVSSAPSIALKPAATPLPTIGAATAVLPSAAVAVKPLNMPLSPAAAAAVQSPTLYTEEEEETADEIGAGSLANLLAGIGLVAALVVLGIQLKISNIWIGAEDNDRQGDWSQLFE